MAIFGTKEPLWYNNGVWGELGFAVPNFGDSPATLNNTIHYLVETMGRNLQAIMLHADADLRTPPSINTLIRVHKLVLRARSILGGEAVPTGVPNMEPAHSQPAEIVFLIHPLPYFRVRNPHLRRWCGLALDALGEAMQHTENRRPQEISVIFAGLVGQYMQRIYRLMATELFGIDASIFLDPLKGPAFVLSDAQLAGYNPTTFFTSTEMIDTVPSFDKIATDDDLVVLTNGIAATQLVGLQRYPAVALTNPEAFALGTAAATAAGGSGAAAGNAGGGTAAVPPPFPAAPGP